ncbi:hypothetical protein AB9F39_38575, partial [Rhizobium leguminosarum]|uniref:hypothetical protein n=1 Tax=Rhizobium leguminosarum TaxID=384 RepID=UPI003F9B7951
MLYVVVIQKIPPFCDTVSHELPQVKKRHPAKQQKHNSSLARHFSHRTGEDYRGRNVWLDRHATCRPR